MRPWILILLCSCGGFDYDELVCGQYVKWGSQQDRDHDEFCATIRECEVAIDKEFDSYAEIEWVSRITDCHRSADGCFYTNELRIKLTSYPTIHESALCHEMLHRQLYLETGDLDHGHKSPDFAILDHLAGR